MCVGGGYQIKHPSWSGVKTQVFHVYGRDGWKPVVDLLCSPSVIDGHEAEDEEGTGCYFISAYLFRLPWFIQPNCADIRMNLSQVG